MKQLQRLGDKLYLADAALAQFDVPLQFSGPDDLRFDAVLERAYFGKDTLADRTGIAERLDHFEKLRRECGIAGDAARFDQHHAFPGLTPLRVIILVTRKR